jgi:hypothetical protein
LAWVNRLDKRGCFGAKKEKKKETPIRSFPMHIRLARMFRLAQTFPASDYLRDIQTLENQQMIGHSPAYLFIASTEREQSLEATTPLGIARPP